MSDLRLWQAADLPSRGALERAIYMHEQMDDDSDTAERMRPVLDAAKAILNGREVVLRQVDWLRRIEDGSDRRIPVYVVVTDE